MTWAVKSLGDILSSAELFIDGDWIESKDQDPDGNIRLLQLADIGDGHFIDKSNRYINEDTLRKLKCTEVKEGDVLIARMPDPLGRACIVEGIRGRCITAVDVCIIRVNSKCVDNRWLMHVINSQLVRTQIANFATGATRVRISRKNLCKIELPFPPLAEQRRIAEQLDTADRILRLREQAIAKLDQLAQSLFYQYDSDASIQYKLSDISEIVSGATPKTEIAEYWGDDICWITPRELTDLPDIFVSDTERKITQKGLRSCAASVLPTNSVLFSSRAPIGHVAINSLPMATNQGFKSFVVKPDLVEPIYLYYWLKSRKRQLQALGVGATFKEVSKSIVSAIDISLPPILTQREFVARTQTIRALKLNMQKGMKDSSALSLTLQNSAFSMA